MARRRSPRPAASTTRPLDHCGWFGGSGGSTRLQLINSSNTVLINQFWNTGGARSLHLRHPRATRTAPTRSAGIIEIRRNSGFLGPRLQDRHRDLQPHGHDRQHHLDGLHRRDLRPAEHHATVSATLTDPNLRHVGAARPDRDLLALRWHQRQRHHQRQRRRDRAPAGRRSAAHARRVTVILRRHHVLQAELGRGPVRGQQERHGNHDSRHPAPVVHGQATSFTAHGRRAPTAPACRAAPCSSRSTAATSAPPVTLVGGTAGSQSTSTPQHRQPHHRLRSTPVTATSSASTAGTQTQVVDKAPTTTAADQRHLADGQRPDGDLHRHGRRGRSRRRTADRWRAVQRRRPAVRHRGAADRQHRHADDLEPQHRATTRSIATYNGNADFASSSSAALTHGVNKAEAAVDLSTSEANAVAGEPLTFTADVTAVGPGAGTPTGTVQFAVDGTNLGGPQCAGRRHGDLADRQPRRGATTWCTADLQR